MLASSYTSTSPMPVLVESALRSLTHASLLLYDWEHGTLGDHSDRTYTEAAQDTAAAAGNYVSDTIAAAKQRLLGPSTTTPAEAVYGHTPADHSVTRQTNDALAAARQKMARLSPATSPSGTPRGAGLSSNTSSSSVAPSGGEFH